MKKQGRILNFLMIMTIALAVLAPPIPITENFSLRPEILLAILLFGLFLAEKKTLIKSPVFKWFILLAGLIIFSISYSGLVLGYSSTTIDYYEVLKVGVYCVIYYVGLRSRVPLSQFSKLFTWIFIIFLISALFGIMQYKNVLGVNNYLTPIYAPTQFIGIISASRIVGTTSNPNSFGFLMILGVCLGLACSFWTNSSRLKWLSGLTLISCLTCILLTTSRSAIVISVLPLLFITYKFINIRHLRINRRKLRRVVFFSIALVGLLVIILSIMPASWYWRLGLLTKILVEKSTSVDVSLTHRLITWQNNWNLYLESPWFGWGPGKGLITYTIDNEWLLLLVRYGILGPVIVFMLGRSLYISMRNLVRGASEPELKGFGIALPELKGFGIAMQAFILSSGVYMVVAGVYHVQQLMAVLMLMTGLGQNMVRVISSDPSYATESRSKPDDQGSQPSVLDVEKSKEG
jgi:O-antigen ligase